MELALRRWDGESDAQRARLVASTLASGTAVELDASDIGGPGGPTTIEPDARLLIVGGGHCGLALYEMALMLDFDLWIYDPRPE